MKTNSRMHKIRVIQHDKGDRTTYGVTIPENFKQWYGCFVTIAEEYEKLVLTSGALPAAMSNKEIKSHSIEVSKVKFNGR